MGDRTLVICTDERGYISPAVYAHWLGDSTADLIKDIAPRLRKGDASYSIGAIAARFWNAADRGEGFASVGLLPGPDDLKPETLRGEYNHGDAGVWVVNVDTGHVQQFKASYSTVEPISFDLDPEQFAN